MTTLLKIVSTKACIHDKLVHGCIMNHFHSLLMRACDYCWVGGMGYRQNPIYYIIISHNFGCKWVKYSILCSQTLPFNDPYHPLNMNNDDISHFSTISESCAIKSNVYFLTHQYLIINNSQSQRALSVSVRTVLWIYFASRRNCSLLPI